MAAPSESANEALQTGPISKEVRDALDAELAIQERMEGFAWAIKSERAYVLESFRNIVPGRNFWLVSRGIWNMQESACLDVFPTLIALAGDPGSYREVEQTIESKKSVLATLLFPALEAAYVAVTRTRAEIRSLRVLNALQTHVPAGSNETPKLSELGLPPRRPPIRLPASRCTSRKLRKAGSSIPSARIFKTTAGSWTTHRRRRWRWAAACDRQAREWHRLAWLSVCPRTAVATNGGATVVQGSV